MEYEAQVNIDKIAWVTVEADSEEKAKHKILNGDWTDDGTESEEVSEIVTGTLRKVE